MNGCDREPGRSKELVDVDSNKDIDVGLEPPPTSAAAYVYDMNLHTAQGAFLGFQLTRQLDSHQFVLAGRLYLDGFLNNILTDRQLTER